MTELHCLEMKFSLVADCRFILIRSIIQMQESEAAYNITGMAINVYVHFAAQLILYTAITYQASAEQHLVAYEPSPRKLQSVISFKISPMGSSRESDNQFSLITGNYYHDMQALASYVLQDYTACMQAVNTERTCYSLSPTVSYYSF